MKRLNARLIMALMIIVSCGKDMYINCEAFNSPLFDQWVPYKSNATYNFSGGSNTEIYTVYTAFRQQKEQQPKAANNTECPPWAHIVGGIGNTGTISFDALSNNGNASGTFEFRGAGFRFTSVADTGFAIDPLFYKAVTKFHPQITIGDKSFSNVQVITPVYDPASPGRLKALYFQKGSGVVAYTYNADTFVIQ